MPTFQSNQPRPYRCYFYLFFFLLIMIFPCCKLINPVMGQVVKASHPPTALGGTIQLTITTVNPTCMNEIGYGGELIGNGVINILASAPGPPYTNSLNLGAPRTLPQANGYFPRLAEASSGAVVTDRNGVTVDTSIVLTNT